MRVSVFGTYSLATLRLLRVMSYKVREKVKYAACHTQTFLLHETIVTLSDHFSSIPLGSSHIRTFNV